jgi:arylsulfatase A-like enzyme
LEKNTILIFASDNGPLPTLGTRTGGLRGAKDSLYEGGTREPLIVRWPGHVPAGRVDDQSVICGVDFLPMFCQLGGAELPKEQKLDGEDLSQAFFGTSITRTNPLYWEYGRNETFGYPPNQRSPNVAIRDGKWKLLINADGSDVQLYDLDADQHETTNVADKNPEVAKRLKDMALKWRKSLPGGIHGKNGPGGVDVAPDS